jgi:hypothetical protein
MRGGGTCIHRAIREQSETDIDRKVSSVTKRNNVCKILVAFKEEKLSLYRRNCDLKYESDYRFLMRLLPYMQQVSSDRKTYVQLKLPDVFKEETYQRVAVRNSLL